LFREYLQSYTCFTQESFENANNLKEGV